MRGIEASLVVWNDVRQGQFASESIRRVAPLLTPGDLTLASSLVYLTLRRQYLWKEIYGRFLSASPSSVSQLTGDALCIGTAGILELRTFAPKVLVNGLVQVLKKKGEEKGARVVNAVLRRIASDGAEELMKIERSGGQKEQALAAGLPGWVASSWRNTWGDEAKSLLKMARIRPYASFRLSAGAGGEDLIERAGRKGIRCWQSPFLSSSLRLGTTIYPRDFPGYEEGLATPQSESSMLVGEVMKKVYRGGPILEMCSGRGVKTGHLASLFPGVPLECMELSRGRTDAAGRELKRLKLGENITLRQGDALELEPKAPPGMISLDAPCSGSGTWSRHPEGKWRLTPEKLEAFALLQEKLLKRALSLIAPGGVVVYSTCSLMKNENENVVAGALSSEKNCMELSFPFEGRLFRRGKPWGTYVLPGLPWVDGFYIALLMNKSGGENR